MSSHGGHCEGIAAAEVLSTTGAQSGTGHHLYGVGCDRGRPGIGRPGGPITEHGRRGKNGEFGDLVEFLVEIRRMTLRWWWLNALPGTSHVEGEEVESSE